MTSKDLNGGPRYVVAENGRDEARPSIIPEENGHDGAWPSRKKPVHKPVLDVFNRTSIVFLTVCSQDKRPLFNKPDVHDLLRMAWAEADAWCVGLYVLMPDHIHLFCAPSRYNFPALIKWVQYWKSIASRQWPRPQEQPIWEKSFWDTQLRRGESYFEKWNYVRNNPVRAGLCNRPDDWPFQGKINEIVWHD